MCYDFHSQYLFSIDMNKKNLKLKKIDQEILQIFMQNQNYGHLTIVTGAFALCKIKFDVLPKNNSFGNPIPLAPSTI